MKIGYTYQDAEFDSEILRSGDFQLISITLDTTARYDPSAASGSTKLPKGLLLAHSSALADETYIDLSTAANRLTTTAIQFMTDVVVLAETILDVSSADQPVKAYLAGTFDFGKLLYSNSDNITLTAAQVALMQKIKVVDGPVS